MEFLALEQIEDLAQDYGYWAVFTGIALENTGVPIPGETITIVGGFLAGSGELSYWLVLLTTIAGAVTGDSCGYWLGRFGGWELLLKITHFFRLPESKVQQAKIQFAENAPQAVFFGRFVTVLRIFAGPIAGIVEMPYTQFVFYNIMGATIWSTVVVTISYFAGRVISLTQLVNLIGQFGFIVLILVVAWIIISRVWQSSRQKQSN